MRAMGLALAAVLAVPAMAGVAAAGTTGRTLVQLGRGAPATPTSLRSVTLITGDRVDVAVEGATVSPLRIVHGLSLIHI